MPASTDAPSSRQKEQERLLEEAKKMPGVADALEAYGRIREPAGVRINRVVGRISYSTGGNEPQEH